MKKYIYPLAIAATLATTMSCSDEEVTDVQTIPDSLKEQISFSLSDEAASTRAGFTGAATHLVMRIQSDSKKTDEATKYTRTVASASLDGSPTNVSYSDVTFNSGDVRYWDDAHGRNSKLSIYAVAIPNGGNSIKNNSKTLEDLIAAGDAESPTKWGTVATNTIKWRVNTTAQEKDAESVTTPTKNIDQEDLVYSNNIQNGGKDGVYRWNYSTGKHDPAKTGAVTHHDGQMLFFQQTMTDETAAAAAVTDAPGHFDQGHMVFNHALSRMTITLIKGEGGGAFKFKEGTNITLLNMNTSGTLNVQTGVWAYDTPTNITKIAQTTSVTSGTAAETFMAQMLPGYTFVDEDDTNVMQFTIDDNTYFITKDMLFDALWNNSTDKGTTAPNELPTYSDEEKTTPVTSYTMEQGKNYVFKIEVNKAKIQSITATLADWAEVTATQFDLDNTHITVTTTKVEGDICEELNLFRLEQELDKIYTDDSYTAKGYKGDYKTNGIATLIPMSDGSHVYQSDWFYKDNKTAYHLRTLNNLAADGTNTNSDDACENVTTPTESPKNSYFTMISGDQATQDYHWGAPMIADATLKYNESAGENQGYISSIHKGFVSPNNKEAKPINITEIHMMSNIYIRLITDSIADPQNEGKMILGPAAVNLENATITLTRFAKTGTVDMGTGFVTPNYVAPTASATHDFVNGDTEDCAQIVAPDFTGTDSYWKRAASIKASTDWYKYAVVPQALRRKTTNYAEADCVGLTIRTSDNNEYYVIKDLASITASAVTDQRDQTQGKEILRWYPGHKYYYTIKITKKGIDAITCTVAKWVDVNADQFDITLEN